MKLILSREHKRNNTQMASINNPLFYVIMKSTGNKIGDTGATSLSEELKSNTTITKLDLSREHKRNTQITSINNPPFYILIKSTGNNIGEAGATSLSDALKSNTTLTKLNLSGKYKRTRTIAPTSTPFFIVIKSTANNYGIRGATSLSGALKSNVTLTELNLSCEDKINNTQMAFISNPPFPFS